MIRKPSILNRIAAGANQSPTAEARGRFHVPKYIGHHGWIGVWLDSPAPDWTRVKGLLEGAFLLAAPKGLAKTLQTNINTTKS